MFKRFFYIFFLLQVSLTCAQTYKDSTNSSTIETLYNEHKNTKWGKYIFKKNYNNANKSSGLEKKKFTDLHKYQGKVIRNISIVTNDPFGKKLDDTIKKPNKYEKLGNKIHLKSKEFTIKNFLIFDKGEKLDTVKLYESERLLLQQNFIRQIKFMPIETQSKDTIDLVIETLDTWAISPRGSLSTSSYRAGLNDRNFAGLGHFVSMNYYKNFKIETDAYNFLYNIPNLGKKYINTNLSVSKDVRENFIAGMSFNRIFYTPLTKWAGGISYHYRSLYDSLSKLNDPTFENYNFKSGVFNVWAGYSKSIYKNQNGFTNLIFSSNYNSINYFNDKTFLEDPYDFYSNENTLIFSSGVISIDYTKDKYIYYDNIIEYIPIGQSFSITTGIQRKNKISRPYIGNSISFGDYFNTGYLGASLQFGTYLQGNKLHQSVIRFEGTYFSRIFTIRNWKFRQFFKPEFVIGFNRIPYEKDKLSLNGRNGIQGFENYHLRGTKKMLLNFQLQSYAPKQWLGFRFNPFLNASLGMIGDNNNTLFEKNLYARVGLGVQINNDYLIFDRLHFSISYFPNNQDRGRNIVRFNDLKNTQFGLQQFNLGQPSTILYE